MLRLVIEEVALFLVPFVLFGLLLVLQRKNILRLDSWSSASLGLTTAGLLLVIGYFLFIGLFSARNTGAYVPPHMEDGRPVPGEFR